MTISILSSNSEITLRARNQLNETQESTTESASATTETNQTKNNIGLNTSSSADMERELQETSALIQQQTQRNLEFSIDDDTSRSVVKLIDQESGEVIRQFPAEEALRVARMLANLSTGLLADKA
jgi:flagellar protein FlaG